MLQNARQVVRHNYKKKNLGAVFGSSAINQNGSSLLMHVVIFETFWYGEMFLTEK